MKIETKEKIKPAGYWQKWKNVERTLNKIIEKNNGRFPTQKEIYEAGFPSLPSAITKYYGGLTAVRKRMRYELSRTPPNYWKSWENVKRKLEGIIEELDGEFPTQKRLYKMGYSGLSNAIIKHHKGFTTVRKMMCYESLTKPAGYWQDWNNVENEMKKVIRKNKGKFPTNKYLIKNGFSGLLSGLKHHGGGNAVREKMGYRLDSKPYGYWKDWNNVGVKLEKIIEELGHFPTYAELKQRNYSGVANAIQSHHGGLLAVKEKMGYSIDQLDLKDWGNVKKEVENIIKKNGGRFPTHKYLLKINYSRLSNAIRNYHGGFNAVREKIRYKIEKKSNGYWKNWRTVKEELEKIIEMNKGEFPTQKFLSKIGFSGLGRAIREYHGGFPSVREKMGYELEKKPMGYWKNFENIKSEMRKAIEENDGKFPIQSELNKMNKKSLVSAITKYHGGINTVKIKMGYELEKKPAGYWQKWKNVERTLNKIIEKNNGRFPTQKEIYEAGFPSLPSAITKYYGGILKVREKMGYELNKKPVGYWQNWGNFKLELEKVIKLNSGKFPTQEFLKKINLSSLYQYFDYHGGMNVVREKMGYESIERPKKYWQDWNNVEKELKEVIEMNDGEFPSQNYLVKNGLSALIGGFRSFGGVYAVREKIGYNEKMRIKLAKELEGIIDRLVA